MQKLRGASEMVGKLVLATAATIVTGGAAAPLALGFLFGVGDQAEKVYQENPNTTGAQELGIFISGLGEAANWYAQGKLGQGALSFIDALKVNGIKQKIEVHQPRFFCFHAKRAILFSIPPP